MWKLIHDSDQGGCGGVAWETDKEPQDHVASDWTAKVCSACGGKLEKWHFRVRNFESGER
jgi:hypothetical protein